MPLLLLLMACPAPAPAPEEPAPEPSPPAPRDCEGFERWLATEGLSARIGHSILPKGPDAHLSLLAAVDTPEGRVVVAQCDAGEGTQWLASLTEEGVAWRHELGFRECCGERWLYGPELAPVPELPGAWSVRAQLSYAGEYKSYKGTATWVGWPGREVHASCAESHGVPLTWGGGVWAPGEAVYTQFEDRAMVGGSWLTLPGAVVVQERWFSGWSEAAEGDAPEPQLASATRTLRLREDGGVEEICDAPDGHPWVVRF